MKKGEHNGRKAGGDRGLYDYGCIRDTYGNTITVRTSSAACVDAVWLFVKDCEGHEYKTGCVGVPDGISVVTAHLDKRAAKRLIEALQRFIEAQP